MFRVCKLVKHAQNVCQLDQQQNWSNFKMFALSKIVLFKTCLECLKLAKSTETFRILAKFFFTNLN